MKAIYLTKKELTIPVLRVLSMSEFPFSVVNSQDDLYAKRISKFYKLSRASDYEYGLECYEDEKFKPMRCYWNTQTKELVDDLKKTVVDDKEAKETITKQLEKVLAKMWTSIKDEHKGEKP